MTNLYRSTLCDSQFTSDGIGYFIQHGEPDTVRGTPMVRLSHGTIVPAKGWHAEHSDAVFEAAQRIEELGRRLIAQADRLRAQAGNTSHVA